MVVSKSMRSEFSTNFKRWGLVFLFGFFFFIIFFTWLCWVWPILSGWCPNVTSLGTHLIINSSDATDFDWFQLELDQFWVSFDQLQTKFGAILTGFDCFTDLCPVDLTNFDAICTTRWLKSPPHGTHFGGVSTRFPWNVTNFWYQRPKFDQLSLETGQWDWNFTRMRLKTQWIGRKWRFIRPSYADGQLFSFDFGAATGWMRIIPDGSALPAQQVLLRPKRKRGEADKKKRIKKRRKIIVDPAAAFFCHHRNIF